MVTRYVLLGIVTVACTVNCWHVPRAPGGKRSQYHVQDQDGSYSYGYDAGSHYAQQSADADNQVDGQFSYENPVGELIRQKYTAGVQGYVPYQTIESVHRNYHHFPPFWDSSTPKDGFYKSPDPTGGHAAVHDHARNIRFVARSQPAPNGLKTLEYSHGVLRPPSPDNSYSFGYATNDQSRSEQSDQYGNVVGSYSYTDEAGRHDLSYKAGPDTGFVTTGGSLSRPTPPQDTSYNFAINTPEYLRHDAQGNVEGSYSYPNPAGAHDLGYVAGAGIGFRPTGGSLSTPNGLGGLTHDFAPTHSTFVPTTQQNDASYRFTINTNDYNREESSDVEGNVHGKYSYRDEAGVHDLSYIAGSSTGFVATGGSLATPNGLAREETPVPTDQPDGSYSFSIDTVSYKRKETSDADGNVKGEFSYKNEAGVHDLQYVAGSQTGYLPTGGSLSVPNGLRNDPYQRYAPTMTGAHGSYRFAFDTPSYKREESSDADGNVSGKFTYTDDAGDHDLSFVAGSRTGYLPTGGSLAVPNGLNFETYDRYAPTMAGEYVRPDGDASYKFSFDTPNYSRQESADAAGNVAGEYKYKDEAGTHDLSFVAGPNGYRPTGGNLKEPPGVTNQITPSVHAPTARRADNISIKAFVAPFTNEYGYVYGNK